MVVKDATCGLHVAVYGKVPPRMVLRKVTAEPYSVSQVGSDGKFVVHQYGVSCVNCGKVWYIDTPIVEESNDE